MVLWDEFQLMAMILGFNWLLLGSNTYHYFFIQEFMPYLWFQEN